MYILKLLISYIILSHIFFYKIWTDLFTLYNKLLIKYDSKQWVNGLMSPLIKGMLYGYSTNYDKNKYIRVQ